FMFIFLETFINNSPVLPVLHYCRHQGLLKWRQCQQVLNNYQDSLFLYNFLLIAGIEYKLPVLRTAHMEILLPWYHLQDRTVHPGSVYILFWSMCRNSWKTRPIECRQIHPKSVAFVNTQH